MSLEIPRETRWIIENCWWKFFQSDPALRSLTLNIAAPLILKHSIKLCTVISAFKKKSSELCLVAEDQFAVLWCLSQDESDTDTELKATVATLFDHFFKNSDDMRWSKMVYSLFFSKNNPDPVRTTLELIKLTPGAKGVWIDPVHHQSPCSCNFFLERKVGLYSNQGFLRGPQLPKGAISLDNNPDSTELEGVTRSSRRRWIFDDLASAEPRLLPAPCASFRTGYRYAD